jgi:hypothetical protein
MKNISIILIVIYVLIVISCSDNDGNNAINNIEDTTNYYFFDKNITYWEMKNNSGNTAYFQALEKDSIFLAMRFWDTANKINVIATPIQFIYWEDGMKKRKYFAIVEYNDKLYFATKKHPMIADYNLDYYVYLFNIPSKAIETNCVESDSIEYLYGTQIWKMNYIAEWNLYNDTLLNKTYKIYNLQYIAFNNMFTPQSYYDSFSFIAGFGFYEYMGYTFQPDTQK